MNRFRLFILLSAFCGAVFGQKYTTENLSNLPGISGGFGVTFTVTGTTNITLPTSGTMVTSTVTTLSSLVSIGTITTGVWNGTIITGTYGGTGINNGSSTITIGGNFATSGAFTTTLTVTANTNVTLPTSGTLVNNAVTTLSSLVSIGTITTGTWNGTVVGATYGGTGVNNGSNTITLAGNLTTSGAFALTLTTTASTNVTLPTTGVIPHCDRYTLNNNGSNWTVAVNGGSAVAGIAIPAATTSSPVLFALGANEIVTGVEVKNTTAWSGTGFTSITVSVGDSVGGTTFYLSSAFEQVSTVGNTNFSDSTEFKKATFAGSNVVAALTGNQNLNTNTITGVTDFRVCRATTL